MRLVVLFIGLPVAVGLMLVSLLANWRFGIRLGADTGDAIAYGLASISADGLKIVLPFAIAWAWRRRRVAEWLSAATLWLVISIYSLVSALSFAAVNRAEIGERRLIAAESYATLKSETAQKRSERGRLAAARPADAIQVEMRALTQQPGFSASARCTAPMGRSARLLCKDYLRLASEFAIAERAAVLDREIAVLDGKLASAAAAPSAGDPQVDLFRDLSGLGEGTIKAALAVLVCALIELGSGLGLFVVLSFARALSEDESADALPRPGLRTINAELQALLPSDDDWARTRLERSRRAVHGAAELYADYRLWLESRGRTNAMTVTAFGRWMNDLGVEREKAGGRVVYRGVRLKSAALIAAGR